jgi:hypothetical protein
VSSSASLTSPTVTPALNQTSVGVPISVSVDAIGNLWVSDNLYMRVLEFQPPFVNGMKAVSFWVSQIL